MLILINIYKKQLGSKKLAYKKISTELKERINDLLLRPSKLTINLLALEHVEKENKKKVFLEIFAS